MTSVVSKSLTMTSIWALMGLKLLHHTWKSDHTRDGLSWVCKKGVLMVCSVTQHFCAVRCGTNICIGKNATEKLLSQECKPSVFPFVTVWLKVFGGVLDWTTVSFHVFTSTKKCAFRLWNNFCCWGHCDVLLCSESMGHTQIPNKHN